MNRGTHESSDPNRPPVKGRDTTLRPPNRFERVHSQDDFEHLDPAEEDAGPGRIATEYLLDDSQTIVSTKRY